MSIKVAINGYGRIGRNILRAHYEGAGAGDTSTIFRSSPSMIWAAPRPMRT